MIMLTLNENVSLAAKIKIKLVILDLPFIAARR
jgi:hypothetical protein